MQATTSAVGRPPGLSCPRERLRACNPLLSHGLVAAAGPPGRPQAAGLSPVAARIGAALAAASPLSLSLFDVAARVGVPLGAVTLGVEELVGAGRARLGPVITPRTEAARHVAARLGELGAPAALTPRTSSARIAVAGSGAEALVHAAGLPQRVLRSRMPCGERTLRVVRLSLGDAVAVHVVADAATRGGVLWQELVRGALGVVVAADPARVEEAAALLDACQDQDLPHALAVVDPADAASFHRALDRLGAACRAGSPEAPDSRGPQPREGKGQD